MVSEVGLNGPPPPAIDILANAVGLQAGDGLGLGVVPVTAAWVAVVARPMKNAPVIARSDLNPITRPVRFAERVVVFFCFDVVILVLLSGFWFIACVTGFRA
jgi:hypothetical protein